MTKPPPPLAVCWWKPIRPRRLQVRTAQVQVVPAKANARTRAARRWAYSRGDGVRGCAASMASGAIPYAIAATRHAHASRRVDGVHLGAVDAMRTPRARVLELHLVVAREHFRVITNTFDEDYTDIVATFITLGLASFCE